MNNFLHQHIKKGQQLNRGFFLINWGRRVLRAAAFTALLVWHGPLTTWLYGSYNFPLSMAVFMLGIYLLGHADCVSQSLTQRWFEKRGYVVKQKLFGPKLVTPSERTVERIYNNFTQLPNTLEHALMEQQLRKLKDDNRLPHSWWRELDEHVCKTLDIAVVKIEDAPEQCVPSTLWQRLKI